MRDSETAQVNGFNSWQDVSVQSLKGPADALDRMVNGYEGTLSTLLNNLPITCLEINFWQQDLDNSLTSSVRYGVEGMNSKFYVTYIQKQSIRVSELDKLYRF